MHERKIRLYAAYRPLLAMCVLDISKSTSKVGLVYLVSTLGFVVFTILGGYLGDNLSRRKILVFSDFGRALVVLLMIVAFTKGSLALLYLTSFLLSTLSSLQRPSRLSTWAENVPGQSLERYNSLSELSIHLSTIAGPLIASFFVAKSWANVGFTVDALTFFLCAIVFAVLVPKQRRSIVNLPTVDQSILKGFKIIAQHKEMFRYVAYDACQMLGFGAFNATFLVLAQRDFGWSKMEFSYHLSIIALFCTITAFVGATRVAAKISPKNKLVVCACISAASLWALLYVKTFPWCSLLFGLCNGMSVLTVSVTRTRVQLLAKSLYPSSLASIIAARSVIIRAVTVFGIGLCFFVDDLISLEKTLMVFVLPIALSFLPLFIESKEAAVASQ